MTRAFLKSLLPADLEGRDAIIDSIIETHGVGIEAEKAKTSAAVEKEKEQAETAKKTLEAVKKDYEEKLAAKGDDSKAEADLKKLQEDFDKAKEAHAEELKTATEALETLKTEHATAQTNNAMDEAVKVALLDAGMSERLTRAFIKASYDRTQLKQEEDGKFSNIDKFVESVKADPEYKDDFGQTETKAADTGSPPAGRQGGNEAGFDFQFNPVRDVPKADQ